MLRTLIIEIDEGRSRSMKTRFDRTMKKIFNDIRDQLKWGDTERRICDLDGNTIGRWRLTVQEPAS